MTQTYSSALGRARFKSVHTNTKNRINFMPENKIVPRSKIQDKLPHAFADQELGGLMVGANIHEKSHEEPLVGIRGFVGTEAEYSVLVSPMEAGVLGIDGEVKIHVADSEKDATHGVVGISEKGKGVLGRTTKGVAVQGETNGPGLAGKFIGNVEVVGQFVGNVTMDCHLNMTKDHDIMMAGEDCAEYFDIVDTAAIEPGAIMVIRDDGSLSESRQAYDRRVAGVVSGAGDFRPGIVLGKLQQSERARLPIALIGKVFCKVDATYGSVEVGDQLTTSSTAGHAMKVGDPLQAFGCVIGKALRPLKEGRGLIPVLVALQ